MGDALIMLHFKFEPSIPIWFEGTDILVSNFVQISQNSPCTSMVSVLPLWLKITFKLQIFT